MKVNYLIISNKFNFLAEATIRSLSSVSGLGFYIIHVGKSIEYANKMKNDNVIKEYFIDGDFLHWEIIEKVLAGEFEEVIDCDLLFFVDHDIWFDPKKFSKATNLFFKGFYSNPESVMNAFYTEGDPLGSFIQTPPFFSLNVRDERIKNNHWGSWEAIYKDDPKDSLDTGRLIAKNLEKDGLLNRYSLRDNDLEYFGDHFWSIWYADSKKCPFDHNMLIWYKHYSYDLLNSDKFCPSEEEFYEILNYRMFSKWYNEQIENNSIWKLLENHEKIIQFVIDKKDYKRYLEIGLGDCENFEKIFCDVKVGVDPNVEGYWQMSSDNFFAQNRDCFDIIFIDGEHHKDTVIRDVYNSLNCLGEDGVIVLHDSSPHKDIIQRVPRETSEWTGDVWKAVVYFRQFHNLDVATVDLDYGITLIKKRNNQNPLENNILVDKLSWSDLVFRRHEFLNLKSTEDLMRWI